MNTQRLAFRKIAQTLLGHPVYICIKKIGEAFLKYRSQCQQEKFSAIISGENIYVIIDDDR